MCLWQFPHHLQDRKISNLIGQFGLMPCEDISVRLLEPPILVTFAIGISFSFLLFAIAILFAISILSASQTFSPNSKLSRSLEVCSSSAWLLDKFFRISFSSVPKILNSLLSLSSVLSSQLPTPSCLSRTLPGTWTSRFGPPLALLPICSACSRPNLAPLKLGHTL
ncbi:hypothetical protein M0R45_017175 [Rubus argutus]|uniref:Uncharacterized protein n=1 Tax=Rubus argutus TaxID=59490 RepID=A0AAW1XVF1_RUBAR